MIILTIITEVVICEIIEDLYGKIRELTKELADIIEVTELDHFVVGDLQSVEEYYNIEKYKIITIPVL